MADYPDWTDLIQIVGADIMVPIDLQAAYIMCPVDIQAQYVTLDIDIVAQTVGDITVDIAAQSVGNIDITLAASDITLDINIAASDVTLNVDVTAQTVGNITIDVEAQSVGVYIGAEWETKEGNEKYLTVQSGFIDFGQTAYTTYTVPSGKTYFITHFGFGCRSEGAADGDSNQIGEVFLYNNTDSIVLARIGGNGGNGLSFPAPIRVVAGKELRLYVSHYANHSCNVWGVCGGYVI